MRIALYQPDIAGNVGTVLRLCACLQVPCDIIEPCGFAFHERGLKRAGMDYAGRAEFHRHADWNQFLAFAENRDARIVLLSNRGEHRLDEAQFTSQDILLMGSESAGVPDHVRDSCAASVRIPMAAGFRSLNIAVATGIALGEALRQTRNWPDDATQEIER